MCQDLTIVSQNNATCTVPLGMCITAVCGDDCATPVAYPGIIDMTSCELGNEITAFDFNPFGAVSYTHLRAHETDS